MDINTYSKLAIQFASRDDLMGNACFGIGGESGEILDLVKKHRYHGKELDMFKLKAEIGDLIWYINALIHACDSTWEEVLEMNFKKLSARYPEGHFDPGRANNRDVAAEEQAMK